MIEESAEIETLQIGMYEFEVKKRNLKLDSTVIKLPNMEAKVLEYFIRHANKLLQREEMVACLWGKYDYFKGRSMDVSIARIRKYLRGDPRLKIVNTFGIGFTLVTNYNANNIS